MYKTKCKLSQKIIWNNYFQQSVFSMVNFYYLTDDVCWGHLEHKFAISSDQNFNKKLHYKLKWIYLWIICRFFQILLTVRLFLVPSERGKLDAGDTLRTWYLPVSEFIANCCCTIYMQLAPRSCRSRSNEQNTFYFIKIGESVTEIAFRDTD